MCLFSFDADDTHSVTGSPGESKQQTLNKAIRAGNVTTTAKYGAGGNSNAGAGKDLRKLDAETENFEVKKVDRNFAKALQSARLAKKMNQKQFFYI